MRDDRTVSPAFSTYAVGGRRPSSRTPLSARIKGQRGTGPAIAVVVTASAIAITFAAGAEWTDEPAGSLGMEREAAAPRDTSGFSTSGFSFGAESSGPSPIGVGRDSSSSVRAQSQGKEHLPRLATASIDISAISRKRMAAVAEESLPIKKTPPAVAFANNCEPPCSAPEHEGAGTKGELAAPGQISSGSSLTASDWSDAGAVQQQSARADAPIVRSSTGLVVDAMPETALLADLQPASLVAPAGDLVAGTPAVERPLAAEARASASETTMSPLGSEDSMPQATPVEQAGLAASDFASARPEAPKLGQSTEHNGGQPLEQDHSSEPTRAIAHHLERIGSRYAAGPETPTRAAPDLPPRDATGQLAVARADDAVSVVIADRLGAAPAVIKDDELVSIKLRDLVSLFEDRLERPLYVWMKQSETASKYVTVETLAAAGIGAKYDPQTRQVVLDVTDQ